MLGPVPLPDGFKGRNDFKKEIIAGESQLSPKEGDEVGELQWRKIPLETATLDLRRLFGEKAAGGDAQPGVAYACGRVYSEAGGTLALSVMGFGRDLKLWLNGRLTKPGVDRSSIALARGWNRLLFRTVSPSDKHNPSWYIKPVFFGAAGCDYETRNIAWSCPMPVSDSRLWRP